jgi:hypothetical protein
MRRCILLLPLLILPFACADDDVGDAPDGWRASSQALQLGQSAFETDVEYGVDGSISVACPDGGTVAVEGHYDGDDDFALSVSYASCECHDVKIDGTLTLAGSATVTETSVEVSVEYRGTLNWSGAANGSCDIDVDAYVAVSTDGGTASGEYRFDGEICGHSAKAVIEASAELD